MSDIDRFAMPPRQTEKPFVNNVKKQANNSLSRVDSIEMPPRSGGRIPTRVPHNTGNNNKFQQNGSGKFHSNNPNAAMDVRNFSHQQSPVLQQPFGSYNSHNPRPTHTGGPIRHERPQLHSRGSPYNIPPPYQYPILNQNQSSQFQPPQIRHNAVPHQNTLTTPRNVGNFRTNNNNITTTNGRNLHTPSTLIKSEPSGPIKISFSNDSLNNFSENSSAIQQRLDSLEKTQKLLLRELEANKKGLENKDAEIQLLTSTIQDQKLKLKKDQQQQTTKSNNNNNNNHTNNNNMSTQIEDNYRITSNVNRGGYDEDDDTLDTTTQPVGHGSINAMFARARNSIKQPV